MFGVGRALHSLAIFQRKPIPSPPVRLLFGFPPGGPNDILARLTGQWLTDGLGAPFGVENEDGMVSW